MADLLEHIDVSYDAERGLAGLQRRIKRRRIVRASAGAVAMVALALIVWPRSPVPSALRTEDGSVATRLSPDTELAVANDRSDAVELELKRGRGHFEVTKNPKRRYRVRSGAVLVEVLGTAFDVIKRDAHTEVRVNHGLVRVRWPAGEALLHAGEHGVYPPPPAQVAAAAQPPIAAPAPADAPRELAAEEPRSKERLKHRTRKHHARAEPEPKDDGWRALARAGRHREAFGALAEQPVEDLEGLLLAADAARLSGHPREAAEHLGQLVRKYPDSAPARLAAFTLGRLQLNELADPQRAANSFARAYALDPKGPLAEDALAREAEAYRRAGDRKRAAEVATRYLAQFPHGSRRSEMSAYLAAPP